MSEPDSFQVDSESLASHAGEMDEIGDGLTAAAQAGRTVRTANQAYGQLCQFVPDLLSGLQQDLIDGMETAARSAHETADTLRSAAASYDTADAAAADRIRNAR